VSGLRSSVQVILKLECSMAEFGSQAVVLLIAFVVAAPLLQGCSSEPGPTTTMTTTTTVLTPKRHVEIHPYVANVMQACFFRLENHLDHPHSGDDGYWIPDGEWSEPWKNADMTNNRTFTAKEGYQIVGVQMELHLPAGPGNLTHILSGIVEMPLPSGNTMSNTTTTAPGAKVVSGISWAQHMFCSGDDFTNPITNLGFMLGESFFHDTPVWGTDPMFEKCRIEAIPEAEKGFNHEVKWSLQKAATPEATAYVKEITCNVVPIKIARCDFLPHRVSTHFLGGK